MDRMPRVRGSPWVTLLLACCSIVFVANTYFSSRSAESLTESRENEFPLRAGPVFHTALYPEISSSPRHMRRVYRPLLSMLQEWEPDNPNPPEGFTEFLQHFNYSDPSQRLLAEKYRRAELPFKVYDVPIFNNVSRMWTDEYLSHNLRKMRFGKGSVYFFPASLQHACLLTQKCFCPSTYTGTTLKNHPPTTSCIGQWRRRLLERNISHPRKLCQMRSILILGVIWPKTLTKICCPHLDPTNTLWQVASVAMMSEILFIATCLYFEVIHQTCSFLPLIVTKVQSSLRYMMTLFSIGVIII